MPERLKKIFSKIPEASLLVFVLATFVYSGYTVFNYFFH